MNLCGNQKIYENIDTWIKKKTQTYNERISCEDVIFVCGNSGIGKTYSIKQICKENDLFVIYLSSNTCSSSAELSDHIIKASSSSMLQCLQNNKSPKIIILDNFDSMLTADRTMNCTLLNILTAGKLKRVPIICISSLEIMKRIGSIKNKCTIFEIQNPGKIDITKTLNLRYPNNENIKTIVDKYSSNLLQCVNHIENNTFSLDSVDDLIDINILYEDIYDRHKITRVILTDPWIIPLRFHENIITELKNRKIPIHMINSIYTSFILNLINYDMLMHRTSASKYVSEIFTEIIYPIVILQKKKKTNNVQVASFTKLLSFISLQKKNIKKNYTRSFPIYQINSYHLNITRNYIHFN